MTTLPNKSKADHTYRATVTVDVSEFEPVDINPFGDRQVSFDMYVTVEHKGLATSVFAVARALDQAAESARKAVDG